MAVLMVHAGETVPFDTIADALWPNKPYDESSNTLRVHMSNLRKWLRTTTGPEVAELVKTKPSGYELSLPRVELDTGRFEIAFSEAQVLLASGEVRAAADAFGLLTDSWGEPYPSLADYVGAEAERVRLTALHELAQDELAAARLQLGEGAELIGGLEARVSEYPYREQTYRQLMTALYSVGRQADALEVYARARTTLLDDLGVDPGPQLQATQAAILRQELEIAAPAPKTGPGGGDRNGAFAGRDAEIATALETLNDPGFLVLFGEAGIGKTRLLHHLQQMRPNNHWVSCTAARDSAAPPMWPVLNALNADEADLPVDAASVFRRNADLIALLTSQPNATLIIDDFHWADESTVQFVRQIANSRPIRLNVVLALRSATIDLQSPAGLFATEVRRQPIATPIDLGPLDLAAVRDLAEQLAPGIELSAKNLLKRSGGNALFLNELLRDFSNNTDEVDVPAGVTAVVHDRLTDIDETAAEVLSIAATIGPQIELDLLLRVAQHSVEEVVAAVESGRELGFVAVGPDGQDQMVHALIRDALRDRITGVERLRMHDRIADALEQRGQIHADGPARLAYHALESLPIGDAGRAVAAAMAVGTQAAEQLAFSDALHRFEQAASSAELLDGERKAEVLPGILCELGYSAIRSGSAEAGTVALKRASALARQSGDVQLLVRAARYLTEGRSPPGLQHDEIGTLVEEALSASPDLVSEDRVQLLIDRAGIRYFSHDLEHRRRLVNEAISLAEQLGSPRGKAVAMTGKWTAINAPSTAEERVEVALDGARWATRAGSTDQHVVAMTLAVGALLETGDGARARTVLADASRDLKNLQVPRLSWFVSGWNVLLLIMDGQLDEAESFATEALMAWEGGEHPDGLSAFGGQLMTIRLMQGRGAEVEPLLTDVLADEPDHLAYRAIMTYGLMLAGDSRARKETLHLLETLVPRARQDTLLCPALAMAAEAMVLAGDIDPTLAKRLADVIDPVAHLHVAVNVYGTGGFFWGSLHHAHGLALQCAGDIDGASAAFNRAIEENTRVGSTAFTARSQAALALTLS